MRKLKVGIYDYYLDSFGGGEKDVCVMAGSLSRKYQVDILSYKDVSREELESRMNVDLSGVNVRTVLPFTGYGYASRSLRFLAHRLYRKRLTEQYDLFIDLVNYVPLPSYAKRSALRIQFPTDSPTGLGSLKSYQHYMVYSEFSRNWTKRRWNVDAEVLHPPVETFAPGKKEDVILSVGRFFAGGHNKKHIEMVKAVKKMFDRGLKGWEYHIIGNVLPGKANEDYLKMVKGLSEGYPIYIHADAPFSLVREYYAKSKIFIHATGYGEDETISPERYEHFGITTVEAMSAGCVPVVIDGGGQREIVTHGKDGYLWRTEEELAGCCLRVAGDPGTYNSLSGAAIMRSHEFGMDDYRERVLDMANRLTYGLQ